MKFSTHTFFPRELTHLYPSFGLTEVVRAVDSLNGTCFSHGQPGSPCMCGCVLWPTHPNPHLPFQSSPKSQVQLKRLLSLTPPLLLHKWFKSSHIRQTKWPFRSSPSYPAWLRPMCGGTGVDTRWVGLGAETAGSPLGPHPSQMIDRPSGGSGFSAIDIPIFS